MKPAERLNEVSPDEIRKALSKYSRKDGEGCWIWTGPIATNGYGRVHVCGFRVPAHRAAYVAEHGPIPPAKFACHRCDNRRCVNPSHLFPGTNSENLQDAADKGRLYVQKNPSAIPRGERHGRSRLTAEIVSLIKSNPDRPSRDLAHQFGVEPCTIRDIRNGRTWAHIAAAIRAQKERQS